MWKELSEIDLGKRLESAIKPAPIQAVDVRLGQKLKKHEPLYMKDLNRLPSHIERVFYSYYFTAALFQADDRYQEEEEAFSSFGITFPINLDNWDMEWNLINTYFQSVRAEYSTEDQLFCSMQNARPHFNTDFLNAFAKQKLSPLITLLCSCIHHDKKYLLPDERSRSRFFLLETKETSTHSDFFGQSTSEPDSLYYLPIACSFEEISQHPLWLDFHAQSPQVILETESDASGLEEVASSIYLLYSQ